MRIHIHVKGFYDWEPVPADVEVTKQDIDAGKVRPSANSGHVMRVPKVADTHVFVQLTESRLIAEIIHAYTDKGKQGLILTRHEAVARFLAETIVPIKTNRKWMKYFEVEDEGPSEELFRAMIAPHLLADHGRAPGKNIDAEDVDELVAAYLAPMDSDGHRDHLHGHFKLPAIKKPEADAAEEPVANEKEGE